MQGTALRSAGSFRPLRLLKEKLNKKRRERGLVHLTPCKYLEPHPLGNLKIKIKHWKNSPNCPIRRRIPHRPGPVFHARYLESWNSTGAKKLTLETSRRELPKMYRSILVPSWLSNNELKRAPRGCVIYTAREINGEKRWRWRKSREGGKSESKNRKKKKRFFERESEPKNSQN